MTRDPLLRAADIRAATVNVRTNPGTDKGALGKGFHLLRGTSVDATDELWAARAVARFTMLRPHGCTGLSCRSQVHGRDSGRRDDALEVLGLAEDPSLPPLRPYPGYGIHQRERSKP